ASNECAGLRVLRNSRDYFLTRIRMHPIVIVFRHSCRTEAVVSCRVAEGNGPADATTTGSGTSLIIWCQFPPGLRGTSDLGEHLPRPTIPDEAFVFLGRAGPSAAKVGEAFMNPRIYFDHSATTPLDPRVLTAMEPYLGGAFGNPSSVHYEGRMTREAVETARAQVASLIGAEPDEIIFTASGTEADNLALIGAMRASGRPGHVVT